MRFDVQRLLRAKEGSKFRDAFFGKVLKNAGLNSALFIPVDAKFVQ